MKLHNLFEEQIDEIAGAFPTPSAQQAMYKAAAQSNAAEAKRQAELAKQADAERLQKNTELVDKEQKVNYHSLDAEPKAPVKEGDDERKQNALWAQITAHEKAAKKSKDLKKQHHLKMADQLRSQLKTSDNKGVEEGWDPDTQRLEQDVRDALENGDDYTAKQYAKMAPTPEAKKYLLNIIKQAMYIDDLGGETDWKGVDEGVGKDIATLGGIATLGIAGGLAGNYADQQQPKVEIGGKIAFVEPAHSRVPDSAMTLTGKDGKTYRVWATRGTAQSPHRYHAVPVQDIKEFAPGKGSAGRWYNDSDIAAIVGDGWYNEMDVSGDAPKQFFLNQAQDWLESQGYSVDVLDCKINDDDMDWYISGTLDRQGVAEGSNDTIYPNAEVIKSKNGKPVGEIYQDGNEWGCFHYKADRGYDMIDSREDAIKALKDLHSETARHRPDYTVKGVAESWIKLPNGNYRNTHTGVQQSSPPKKEKRKPAPIDHEHYRKQQERQTKAKQGVTEVSDEVRNRYVARASDDYGSANFAARASKSHPGLEKYSQEQEKRARKRATGLGRALSDKRRGAAEGRDMCNVCGQTPCNCTHLTETRAYYNVIGTPDAQLRSEFGMRKDRNGWFLKENVDKRKQLAAFRAFGAPKLKEFNLANFSGSAATKGEDNIISPVGSGRKGK